MSVLLINFSRVFWYLAEIIITTHFFVILPLTNHDGSTAALAVFKAHTFSKNCTQDDSGYIPLIHLPFEFTIPNVKFLVSAFQLLSFLSLGSMLPCDCSNPSN